MIEGFHAKARFEVAKMNSSQVLGHEMEIWRVVENESNNCLRAAQKRDADDDEM